MDYWLYTAQIAIFQDGLAGDEMSPGNEEASGLKGPVGEAQSIARSPSGEKLVSASSEPTLMAWDATSGAQVKNMIDWYVVYWTRIP
jgi:WD40 repeat protein